MSKHEIESDCSSCRDDACHNYLLGLGSKRCRTQSPLGITGEAHIVRSILPRRIAGLLVLASIFGRKPRHPKSDKLDSLYKLERRHG